MTAASFSAEYGASVERRMRRRKRVAYTSVATAVAAIIALSTVVEVAGAVIASGNLSVASQTKSVSHPSGGVLSRILVRDGQRVRAGDILVQLDTNVAGTSADVSEESVVALAARRDRLEAELQGRPRAAFSVAALERSDPDARASINRERELFEARQAENGAQIAMLAARRRQLEAEITGFQSRIASLRRQQALLAPELRGLRELYEQELVTINRLNEIERTDVTLRGEIATMESNIRQSQARIAEAEREMGRNRQSLRTSAGQELNQVVTALGEGRLRTVDAQDALERATIRAPQNGLVDSIAFVTPGSAVPAGQPILRIIPSNDNLVAEVRVSPGDIDQVRIGQPVRLLFSSLQAAKTPEVEGTVRFISPERIDDPRTGQPYYRVHVAGYRGKLRHAGGAQLTNGMPVEAYITTESRSFISYLLKPILDQIERAFTQ